MRRHRFHLQLALHERDGLYRVAVVGDGAVIRVGVAGRRLRSGNRQSTRSMHLFARKESSERLVRRVFCSFLFVLIARRRTGRRVRDATTQPAAFTRRRSMRFRWEACTILLPCSTLAVLRVVLSALLSHSIRMVSVWVVPMSIRGLAAAIQRRRRVVEPRSATKTTQSWMHSHFACVATHSLFYYKQRRTWTIPFGARTRARSF